MKSTSTPFQIGLGVILGIVLQPLSLLMVGKYVIATTGRGTGNVVGAGLVYFACFGMAQVLTILPAALLLLPTGKHGIVRGLLLLGTALALLNVVALMVASAGSWPIPA